MGEHRVSKVRAGGATNCEESGHELVRGNLDRCGQEYWCLTCAKEYGRAIKQQRATASPYDLNGDKEYPGE